MYVKINCYKIKKKTRCKCQLDKDKQSTANREICKLIRNQLKQPKTVLN